MLRDDFMSYGYMPTNLPVSCLTMAPRYSLNKYLSLLHTFFVKLWPLVLTMSLFARFDAKPNQNLIAIRREPLVQLNKDSRNIAVPATTYGENGMIENGPKKLTSGVIASENEVRKFNFGYKLMVQ